MHKWTLWPIFNDIFAVIFDFKVIERRSCNWLLFQELYRFSSNEIHKNLIGSYSRHSHWIHWHSCCRIILICALCISTESKLKISLFYLYRFFFFISYLSNQTLNSLILTNGICWSFFLFFFFFFIENRQKKETNKQTNSYN